jgi:uncharacterized repeat protein (TIGR03806 family)
MMRGRATKNAWFAGLIAALGAATAGACYSETGSNGGPAGTLPDGATAGDGAAADGSKPPPTPAPFGLDARPTNATCLAKPRPTVSAGVKFVDAFPAGITFAGPMKIMMAPGDPNRFYVAERGGSTAKVKTFPKNVTTPSEVTDFATVTVNSTGEGGLLGMAFHPKWETNHTVFLSYTRTFDGSKDPDPAPEPNSQLTSVVSKWTSADNGATVGNPVEILTRVQPYTNHNGGDIAFGPDGFLYFGLGDGGSGNDPLDSGQTLTTLLGKILRIDVDTGSPYGIPPTNPFASSTGSEKKEIYAYGFRNPFRWSFDRDTGDLWVGDVGQSNWEEIDRVELGGNYGWKTCEGFHQRGSNTALCATPGLKDPVVEHDRSEASSITGGVVYRGKAIPEMVGTYVYGDFSQGNIWGIVYDNAGKASSKLLGNVSGVVDFGQDADGEIYLAVLTSGKILKMVPDTTPAPSTFPDKLSKTGCVDPQNPKNLAAGLIPYGVRAELWSDGAAKERAMALPEGTTIKIGDDGDFEFPVGTVLVKSFRVANKLVETRLFMRHDDGMWGGYSYEWDDAETDATLLPSNKVRDLGGGQSWTYPSRSQCFQCHTTAAGSSLGLELAQQNGEFTYPSTNRLSNQLKTLEKIGMFATAVPPAPPALAEPFGGDPNIEARARAYLHANCSQCHRPSGGGGGTIDLRYTRTLAETQTCNAAPKSGAIGPADAKIVFPGDPTKSILSLRVHATDAKRMPPLAVRVPHEAGTKLLDDWIKALTACP